MPDSDSLGNDFNDQLHEDAERLSDYLKADSPLEPDELNKPGVVRSFANGVQLQRMAHELAGSFTKAVQGGAQQFRPVALCGPWGSGKTSFLNLLEHELRGYGWHVCDGSPRNPEATVGIVLNFDPWAFSSRNDLIVEFFRLLGEAYGNENLTFLLMRYAATLDDALSSLKPSASSVTKVGGGGQTENNQAGNNLADKVLGFLKCAVAPIITFCKMRLSGLRYDLPQNFSSLKRKVCDQLLQKDLPVAIVVIDNVDRLTNDEIGYLFRFIGAVVDFPKIMYLLAYDEEVVSRALEGVQKSEYQSYHDKVVSLRIQLPPIDMMQLVKEVFRDILNVQDTREREQLGRSMAALAGNPRGVNRIESSLHARYLMKDVSVFELDGIDGFVDTFLQTHHQAFYGLLRRLSKSELDNIMWALRVADTQDAGDGHVTPHDIEVSHQLLSSLLGWKEDQAVQQLPRYHARGNRVLESADGWRSPIDVQGQRWFALWLLTKFGRYAQDEVANTAIDAAVYHDADDADYDETVAHDERIETTRDERMEKREMLEIPEDQRVDMREEKGEEAYGL